MSATPEPLPPLPHASPRRERRSDLRILMPQRFDRLGRSMDQNIMTQWLALAELCDLVFWGDGLCGYDPGTTIAEAAREVDADCVVLPDFHHGIPGLWSQLWRDAERCHVPVLFYLVDQSSALEQRRAEVERIAPAALIVNGHPQTYWEYDDLIERFAMPLITWPMGFDPARFYPPPADAERDIDLLIAGEDRPFEVYPMRNRMKRVARTIEGPWRIVDLDHPGYWETATGPVQARGQSAFAALLRRTKLAITGTAFDCPPRKYFETAASGAVGIGDLPDHPSAGDMRGAMEILADDASDDEIRATIIGLLEDAPRREALAASAVERMRGCTQQDRAGLLLDGIIETIGYAPRAHGPRLIERPAAPLLVVASAAPETAPEPHGDWRSVWSVGPDGDSRTRRLERILRASAEEVCLIALDPDAGLPADGFALAEAWRRRGSGLVIRPLRDGGATPVMAGCALAACSREALAERLAVRRGRGGLEQALLDLADAEGVTILAGTGFGTPAGDLLLVDAALRGGLPVGAETIRIVGTEILKRAHALQDGVTLREARGWLETALGVPVDVPVLAGDALAQDPEAPDLEPDAAGFLRLRLGDPAIVERVARHLLGPADARPLVLGAAIADGLRPEEAAQRLGDLLAEAGCDPEQGADVVVLADALWEGEIAWLEGRR